jgi:putative Mg2+ transporter-C (MgtC) family protein
MDTVDIVLRLSTATLVGIALGLNRDLHGKQTGVRTLGLVGLGSALVVLAFGHASSADASRVIQGIVTGIGFLGAGVIVRNEQGYHVHGLTTAACVWLTASIGAACGISEWRVILVSLPIVFILLIFGGSLEKAVRRLWPQPPDTESDQISSGDFHGART